MKKLIFLIITVLVVGVVGYQWYVSKASKTPVAAQQIRTAQVQKGKFEVKVTGSGTIQPVTSEDIHSSVENKIADQVLVSAGSSVKAGDTLITFTDGSTSITAPADGVITTISVTAGQRVTNGQVVAHLTNYNDLQTVVQIDELDIPKIKVGQIASIKVNAFPDSTFTGKVNSIAQEGTSTNGVSTFDVTIHVDKPDQLKVGMSTEGSILTASKENAMYVPLEAIHSRNGQKFVLVNSNNADNSTSNTEQKVVKTGLANEDFVEITEGLTGGETVRLPQLAISNNQANKNMMSRGFGGMGMGGMNSGGGRQWQQDSKRGGN